jgi:hypothetical protein
LYHWNSNHKIENNVVLDTRHSIILIGGTSGSAVLYNYSNNNQEGEYSSVLTQDLTPSHGAFPHMNLWEGNIGSKIMADYTQGSSAYNTLFRNWGRGYRDTPSFSSSQAAAFEFGPFVRYYNLVGNVAGMPSWTRGTVILNNSSGSGPYAFKYGYHTDGSYMDSMSYSTSLNYGNYDFITDGVVLWQFDSGKILPASLYYNSKPVFFGSGSIPWPSIGYDVLSITNDIPAKYCFDRNMMPNCLGK